MGCGESCPLHNEKGVGESSCSFPGENWCFYSVKMVRFGHCFTAMFSIYRNFTHLTGNPCSLVPLLSCCPPRLHRYLLLWSHTPLESLIALYSSSPRWTISDEWLVVVRLASFVSRIIRSIVSRRLPFDSAASLASAIVHSDGRPVAVASRVSDQSAPEATVRAPPPGSLTVFILSLGLPSHDSHKTDRCLAINRNICSASEVFFYITV